MTGMANGNSTRLSRWFGVMPTPRDASISAGSTPAIPVTVLRKIGSTPYNVSPMMAGRKPMLCSRSAARSGTMTASSARLGIV